MGEAMASVPEGCPSQRVRRFDAHAGALCLPGVFPGEPGLQLAESVYDGITHIRYFVKENATVRVRIYDLAGDLVTELTGSGIGGTDNEVDWNVGSIQSGISFRPRRASGAGQSGVAVIKVAVVK